MNQPKVAFPYVRSYYFFGTNESLFSQPMISLGEATSVDCGNHFFCTEQITTLNKCQRASIDPFPFLSVVLRFRRPEDRSPDSPGNSARLRSVYLSKKKSRRFERSKSLRQMAETTFVTSSWEPRRARRTGSEGSILRGQKFTTNPPRYGYTCLSVSMSQYHKGAPISHERRLNAPSKLEERYMRIARCRDGFR